MPQPLTGAMITALTLACIPFVTVAINALKPFVELLPWADPNNPADKATHDATLRILNGVLTVLAMVALAYMFGYVSDPSVLWVVIIQIVGVMLGADTTYRSSAKSSNGGAVSGVPVALAALSVTPPPPAPPLHQQASPDVLAALQGAAEVASVAADAPAAAAAGEPAEVSVAPESAS